MIRGGPASETELSVRFVGHANVGGQKTGAVLQMQINRSGRSDMSKCLLHRGLFISDLETCPDTLPSVFW